MIPDMNTPTIDIVACGRVAAKLLCPLSIVRRAAAELSICPSVRINSVDYFSAQDCEAIEARVRDLQRAAMKERNQ